MSVNPVTGERGDWAPRAGERQWPTHEAFRKACEDFWTTPPGAIMSLWVIFKHPRDAPGHWVLRRQDMYEGGALRMGPAWGYKTLEEARAMVRPGSTPFDRSPEDDPAIYETWL